MRFIRTSPLSPVQENHSSDQPVIRAAIQLQVLTRYIAGLGAAEKCAGVANGTFYAHFKDKDEIISAVTEAIAFEIARQLDKLMSDVDCAVTRVATGTRLFMDIVCQNPNLGWAFLKAYYAIPAFRLRVGVFMRSDITRGIKQGVFCDTTDDFLMECIGGLVASAAMSRLSGKVGPEAGIRAAELQLQLLGVAPKTAKKATSKPLDFN